MPEPQDQFAASIASEAVEVLEDHLLFPDGYLLPLSARGSGAPGMADRPWSRLSADVFYPNLPVIYSLALRRQPPDVLRGSLRARRTFFEGFMMALAEKTGRRPSIAERSADHAMDAAESELTFGKPAFQIAEEALLEVAGAEPLILKENEIGVVVTCPRSQQAQWEKINGLASMLREAVTRFTRHTATVGVGAPAPSIAELPRAYGQATMGVSDRFFHGGDHTVRGDLVEPRQGRNAALNRETATQLRLLVQQGSSAQLHRDRKSVVEGKSVDLGGRRVI